MMLNLSENFMDEFFKNDTKLQVKHPTLFLAFQASRQFFSYSNLIKLGATLELRKLSNSLSKTDHRFYHAFCKIYLQKIANLMRFHEINTAFDCGLKRLNFYVAKFEYISHKHFYFLTVAT